MFQNLEVNHIQLHLPSTIPPFHTTNAANSATSMTYGRAGRTRSGTTLGIDFIVFRISAAVLQNSEKRTFLLQRSYPGHSQGDASNAIGSCNFASGLPSSRGRRNRSSVS